MTAKEILIRNTKNLMIENHISQSELARKIGVSQTNISAILLDKQNITIAFVEKVCEVFGVQAYELFSPDASKNELNNELKENKVKALVDGCKASISKNNETIEINKLGCINIKRRTVLAEIKFDELIVRGESYVEEDVFE